MAGSELEEVFLGRDQAGSSGSCWEQPGSTELSQELPSHSRAGRGRREDEMQLLGGQELSEGLVTTELALAPAPPLLPAVPL